MQRILLLPILMLIATTVSAQNYEWTTECGSLGNDAANAVAVSSGAEKVVVGYFSGTVDFDDGAPVQNLTSNGVDDIFVAKYDISGNYVWAFNYGAGFADRAEDVFIDGSDNIYVVGYYSGTVDFDFGAGVANLTSAGQEDVFVAKYDASGNYLMAFSIGGILDDKGYSIALDAANNILVTGYFDNTADFDPGAGTANLTSVGSNDGFVAKYDASGNLLWNFQLGGSGDDVVNDLVVDNAGSYTVVGNFTGTMDVDPGAPLNNRVSNGLNDIILAQYSSSGGFIWAFSYGSTGQDYGAELAVNNDDNLFVTGAYSGTVNFGGSSLVSAGATDVYVAHLDNLGAHQWSFSLGSAGNENSAGISIYGPTGIYIAGTFENTMDFDAGAGTDNFTSNGQVDMFLVRYDAGGGYIGGFQTGGAFDDLVNDVKITSAGGLYLAGEYASTVDFDATPAVDNHTVAGGVDWFVTAYTECVFYTEAMPVNVLCNGQANGSVSNTPFGGMGPYSYLWSNAATTQGLAGLTAGIFSLTATDANACPFVNQVTVTEPAVLNSAPSQSNVTCAGASDGTSTSTPSGGKTPYSYFWNIGSQTTATAVGLPPGLNNLSLTDANGCIFTSSYTITEPAALVVVVSSVSVTCFGASTGSQNAIPSGGTTPYNYLWTNSATTQNINGIPAGADIVTVTDANGCVYQASGTITQPANITITDMHSNVSCNGTSTGVGMMTVIGATSPYSYLWGASAGNQTTATAAALSAGIKDFTVTDANACIYPGTQTITEPAALSSGVFKVDISCNGLYDGVGNSVPGGGTTPYTFLWNTSAVTPTITGLMAGGYSVTVTDANSCTATGALTIVEPTLLNASPGITHVNCFGANDGTANITPSGGTTPYVYIWGSSAFNSTAISVAALSPGVHDFTVTDNRSCVLLENVTITEPPLLSVSIPGFSNIVCNGNNDGTANSGTVGGTTPYTYLWSEGAQTTVVANSLSPGIKTITTTDAKGCKSTKSVTLTEPNVINPSVSVSTNILCNGGSNGALQSLPTGGTPSYTYLWSGGSPNTIPAITGLSAGPFTITVTDVNACIGTQSFTLTDPAVVSANTMSTNSLCNGSDNGTATATPTGGVTPYAYIWSNSQTIASINNLAPSTVFVTVTDANGCSNIESQTITEPSGLVPTMFPVPPSCNGGSDAATGNTSSGGTTPYSYLWSNTATTGTLSGVTAGPYGVTLTDANGCVASTALTITEPTALGVVDNVTNASCNGMANGAFSVTVSGGTPSYSYLWSNAATSVSIGSLVAGSYTVTATDANGCTIINTDNVTEPTAIILTPTAGDVSCFGFADGSLSTIVAGGVSPYTYAWSSLETTSGISGKLAGNFSVTVTDATACNVVSGTLPIAQPAAVATGFTNSDITCFGLADGTSTSTPTGGVTPYSYVWSTSETTASIAGLVVGVHFITLSDGNSCLAFNSTTITMPPALSVSVGGSDVSCNGGSDGSTNATVAGGTIPYTYAWDNGAGTTAAPTGLTAGTYTITSTDANGCTIFAPQNVTEPAVINIVTSPTNATCNGLANGSLNITVTGGTPGYTYLWSNGSTTLNITSVVGGSYVVSVTDANSCFDQAGDFVGQPTAVTVTHGLINPTCAGFTNGSVDATISGGVTPYSYTWSNGPSTEDISGVTAGVYRQTVTDANACVSILISTLTDPTGLGIGLTPIDIACFGGASGSVSSNVTGGTTPYSYAWSNSTTTLNISGLPIGLYAQTVTDAQGCVLSSSVTLTEPSLLIVGMSGTDVSCNGAADGTATATPSGGVTAYTYLWDNGAGVSANPAGLGPNTYSVTVTDANGCFATNNKLVNSPTAVTVPILAVVDISCNGANDGSGTAAPSGGVSPYNYIWSNGATIGLANNLVPGLNSTTVTDATGCTGIGNVTIVEPSMLLVNLTTTDVLCYGNATGGVAGIATGGTTPYVYNWSSGPSTININSLVAGAYTLTTTDANGCVDVSPIVISEPASALTVTVSPFDANCNGANDGSMTSSPSGGTTPYTYFWTNGATTQNISPLATGSYSITVTDANGCVSSNGAGIAEPSALILSTSSADISCNGAADGTGTANITGGVSPYSYQWTNGATTLNATSLILGSHKVTVTDNQGCLIIDSVQITEPAILAVGTTINEPACNGDNTGSVLAGPTGGTTPYSYAWSSSSNLNATETGLAAGTYSLSVTDMNACESVQGITLTDPAIFTGGTTLTDVSCNGANDGAIAGSVAGGTSPYTYLWSNNETTISVINLAPGIYGVTATDANGCKQIGSETVTEPGTLTASASSTNVNCNGAANGTLTGTIGGGSTPYTYLWTTGFTTQNVAGLSAGVYALTVTDVAGCIAISSNTTITEPSVLTVTANSTPVNCNGGNDGTSTVSVAGGTSPFAYVWNNTATTPTITGMTAGVDAVTITDAGGCLDFAVTTVTEPVVLTSSTSGTTNVTCNAGSNGTATMATSGGVTPYIYAWSSSANTSGTETGMTAGIYGVTTTDLNGCSVVSGNFTITEAPAITITSSSADISCNGAADGTGTANPAGGFTPYSYYWSTTETTLNVIGLAIGVHTVTATDANSCIGTGAVTISEPSAITITPSSTNASCNGANDGTLNVAVGGGTPLYSYLWSPGGDVTAAVASASAGVYGITVTDANACAIAGTTTITEPIAITVTASSTPVSCNGGIDGTSTGSIAGGASPYNYLWNNAAINATITGLNAGIDIVTITDGNGCAGIASTTVTEPALLTSSITGTTNVSCAGGADGAAMVTPLGGVTVYTYLWDVAAGSQVTAAAGSLGAGVFTVTVTDGNGCETLSSVTITEPGVLTLTTSSANVSCNGAADGTGTANINGGVPPYTYLWSTSETIMNIIGLPAGVQTVAVTDANGCVANNGVTITEPSAITVTASATNATCAGATDGSLVSSTTGGTSPYTYLWSPTGDVTMNVAAAGAGIHSLTVTDANNCIGIGSTTVSEPSAVTVTASSTAASCNGAADGTSTAIALGGTTVYAYLWNNAANTATATGLVSGISIVTVTDANGCVAITTTTVTEPTEVVGSVAGLVDVSCNGNADGAISMSTSGGTGPYTYLWSPISSTTASVNALTAGIHTVTITDANACTDVVSTTVTEPAVFTGGLTVTNTSCNGTADGSISGLVSGGTSPYSYVWTNAETTPNIGGLTAGIYVVTATDANGCVQTASETVTEPAAITVTASSTNALCNSSLDGTLGSTLNGGVSPFSYNWSSGDATQNVAGIGAGAYVLSVTDANGCIGISNGTTITEPIGLTVTASSTPVNCSGGLDGSSTASVTGGSSPYSYLWNNTSATETITGLIAGINVVTVTDFNGCMAIASTTISEPLALVLATTVTNVSCNGLMDGDATVSVTGGVSAYTYLWDASAGSQVTATAASLIAGSYTVTVTDANGCESIDFAAVVEPGSITLTASSTNASCNAVTDGTAQANMLGGTAPYSFLWNSGQTSGTITGLAVGIYNVTATDLNGCMAIAGTTISEPAALSVTVSSTNANCFGANDGSLDAVVIGGTTPYSYNWTTGFSTANVPSATAGVYIVTITDANACNTTAPTTITEPTAITVIMSATNVNCNGNTDGTGTASASGGTPSYTFNWSTGGTGITEFNIAAGIAVVTITDVNGCELVDQVTITEPTALSVTASAVDATCMSYTDGSIAALANGGTTSYAYMWSNGGTSFTQTAVGAGLYTLTVTDNAGCVATTSTSVSQPVGMVVSTTVTDMSCNGANDGAIAIDLIGGVPTISYAWSNGASTEDLSGLSAGTYALTISDQNACLAYSTGIITEPVAISLTATSTTPATCFGSSNGSINTTINGGTSPFVYQWSGGGTTLNQGSVEAGMHNLTVTDNNGCVGNLSVSVSQPDSIEIQLVATNISCNGLTDGSVVATIIGGTAPFTYSWNSGATTNIASNLGVGSVGVVIFDTNGCDGSDNAMITQPSNIVMTTSVTNVSCNGFGDGNITASTIGGTSPYNYSWSNSENTANISSLVPGGYNVTMTDANGCIGILTHSITENPAIVVTLTDNGNGLPFCVNEPVNVDPGAGFVGFNWSNGATSSTLDVNFTGNVFVTVLDVEGCFWDSDTLSFTVIDSVSNPSFISGIVYNSGTPITSGSVTLIAQSDTTAASMIELVSIPVNSDGSFKFEHVLPGYYIIKSTPDLTAYPNSITTYQDSTNHWEDAILIPLSCEDSVETVEIHMIDFSPTGTGTATINGVVVDGGSGKTGSGAGDPVPGVDITLEQVPGGLVAGHDISDSTGYFEFNNIPMGNYVIHVDLPGYTMDTIQNFGIAQDNQNFTVTICVDQDTAAIDICNVYDYIEAQASKIDKYLKVYPNPASEVITLIFDQGTYEVNIYDMVGRMMYSKENHMDRTTIDVSEFHSGAYNIVVVDTDGNMVHKVLLVE